jgi:hypothetical protein
VEEKFRLNCEHGAWPRERAEQFLAFSKKAFDSRVELAQFRG